MSAEESAVGVHNAGTTGGITHSVGAQKYSCPLIVVRRKPYCSGFGRDVAQAASSNALVRTMNPVKCFI
jgi:hypothetical protein